MSALSEPTSAQSIKLTNCGCRWHEATNGAGLFALHIKPSYKPARGLECGGKVLAASCEAAGAAASAVGREFGVTSGTTNPVLLSAPWPRSLAYSEGATGLEGW